MDPSGWETAVSVRFGPPKLRAYLGRHSAASGRGRHLTHGGTNRHHGTLVLAPGGHWNPVHERATSMVASVAAAQRFGRSFRLRIRGVYRHGLSLA